MKIIVFLFPITIFLVFLCIKLISPDTYLILIQEDSVIEYVQAFIYFLSSIISIIVSIKLLKNKLTLHGVLYAILAVGLLLISLEEMSWGQRIFDISNPDYFTQHNIQNELSFHNLDKVQPCLHKIYILIGAFGSFGWLFISRFKTKCLHIVNFVVPDWYISSYFFFIFLIYTVFDYIHRPFNGGWLLWRDQEPIELLLSLGFLSFVITNYLRSRKCLTGQILSDG